MTDEEKAEEYLKKFDDCRTKELMKQAYLDGLEEGRKEEKKRCLSFLKAETEDLRKENAELKAQIKKMENV